MGGLSGYCTDFLTSLKGLSGYATLGVGRFRPLAYQPMVVDARSWAPWERQVIAFEEKSNEPLSAYGRMCVRRVNPEWWLHAFYNLGEQY